jgi:hypothetical protein
MGEAIGRLATERAGASESARGEGAPPRTTTSIIKSKCARFALDAQDSIRQHPKITGQGLNDRAADTFDPLYVIARHAGPDWETKLHTAAIALNSTDNSDSGTALLLDIFDVFCGTTEDKMFSSDLITRLRQGATASQTLKYSVINEYQISKILRRYGVKPTTIRIGKIVNRGYLAADFREALKRYVTREDAEARMNGAYRRAQLHKEAYLEAQKEETLVRQALASAPPGKVWTISEAVAKVRELQKAAQTNGQKTESANPATSA